MKGILLYIGGEKMNRDDGIPGKIKEPTWVIHAVFDEDGEKGLVYHTHGLSTYGSLELELNLPLENELAMQFINIIGLEIANGLKLTDGDFVDGLFSMPIAFREADGIFGEGERNLRIILPDENGLFPWDEGCNPAYQHQI